MPSSFSRNGSAVRLRAEALPSAGYDAWRAQTLSRMAAHRAASGAFSAEQALVRADEVLEGLLPLGLSTPDNHVVTLHDASSASGAVAWAWLRVRDEEQGRIAFAFDVCVRDDRAADCGAQVMATTEQLARLLGAQVLWHNVFSTDRALVAMLDGRGYEVSASQLRLSVTDPPPADVSDDFELRPMTVEHFSSWFDGQEESYAAELVAAGSVGRREARERSAADMASLLPDGLTTANQLLLSAHAGGQEVGSLWVSVQPGGEADVTRAFVIDVAVHEAVRRRGHGQSMMRAAHRLLRERGVSSVGLSVFGWNTGARALYDGLGYVEVEQLVRTRLDSLDAR